MTKSKGQPILLTAVIVAAALAAFFLHGGMARTSDHDAGTGADQVRMAVDPTVIPSDMPSIPAEAPAETPAETPDEISTETLAEPRPEAPAAPKTPAPETAAPKAAPPAAKAPAARTPAATTPTAPDQKGVITAALESTPQGFVLILAGDTAPASVTHFSLASPARLVLDLPGPWTQKGPNVLRQESGPVLHVVVGAHPDKLRFVVHLRDDSLLARLGEPVQSRQGNTLRVTVPVARQP